VIPCVSATRGGFYNGPDDVSDIVRHKLFGEQRYLNIGPQGRDRNGALKRDAAVERRRDRLGLAGFLAWLAQRQDMIGGAVRPFC
jgi:hypothetical protein